MEFPPEVLVNILILCVNIITPSEREVKPKLALVIQFLHNRGDWPLHHYDCTKVWRGKQIPLDTHIKELRHYRPLVRVYLTVWPAEVTATLFITDTGQSWNISDNSIFSVITVSWSMMCGDSQSGKWVSKIFFHDYQKFYFSSVKPGFTNIRLCLERHIVPSNNGNLWEGGSSRGGCEGLGNGECWKCLIPTLIKIS